MPQRRAVLSWIRSLFRMNVLCNQKEPPGCRSLHLIKQRTLFLMELSPSGRWLQINRSSLHSKQLDWLSQELSVKKHILAQSHLKHASSKRQLLSRVMSNLFHSQCQIPCPATPRTYVLDSPDWYTQWLHGYFKGRIWLFSSNLFISLILFTVSVAESEVFLFKVSIHPPWSFPYPVLPLFPPVSSSFLG